MDYEDEYPLDDELIEEDGSVLYTNDSDNYLPNSYFRTSLQPEDLYYTETTIDDVELFTCNTCWKKLPAIAFIAKYRQPAVTRTCNDCMDFIISGYQARNRQAGLRSDQRRRHGLTYRECVELIEEQNHRCKICHRPQVDSERTFHLDHDHKTGKVRGYLCPNCNNLLGFAHDDPYILKEASRYLEDHRMEKEQQ